MSWMKGTSNIQVTVCDTEDTGWSTAGVVCRIYIHISRISNTLLQVVFYSSSIFKCAISNYFYIYNELKIALQGEATMLSFVPGLLSWRAVILAQFFINTYYCFSTSSVEDLDLHFWAAGAPLETHCQLTSQQETLRSGTNLDEP